MIRMKPPSAKTVAAPAMRIARMIAKP